MNNKLDTDILGMITSILCAIHCLVVPIIALMGSFVGHHFEFHIFFDLAFVSLSSILIYFSFIKKTTSSGTKLIAYVGLGLIVLSFIPLPGLFISSIVGGALLAWAHYRNYINRFRRTLSK